MHNVCQTKELGTVEKMITLVKWILSATEEYINNFIKKVGHKLNVIKSQKDI